jgi:two-component system sensor kinase FixL
MGTTLYPPGKNRPVEQASSGIAKSNRAHRLAPAGGDGIHQIQTLIASAVDGIIVEEALALGLIGAAETNVKVRATLYPALPPAAVDEVQIQRVLINFVRNADLLLQTIERVKSVP